MNTIRSRLHFNVLAASKSVHVRCLHHTSNHLGAVKPFLLADIGEGITECEIVQWFVEPGATVAEFDKICEVQSDKASVEISSRYAGKVLAVHYGKNDIAKVGHPLVDIETDESEEEEGKDRDSPADTSFGSSATTADTPPSNGSTKYVHARGTWTTPAVRRLLEEYGLETHSVAGSGKNGLVLKGDLLSFIKNGSLKKVTKEKKKPENTQQTNATKQQPIVVKADEALQSVPLSAIQKAMFKTMTKSLSIPQLGYKDEIELNAASQYRKSINQYIESNPSRFSFHKISYLPIFIKSLSLSLSYYPLLNAKLQEGNGSPQIVYRESHNIGIAMDTPQGLIVPNIKDVQNKTILDVAHEIHRLTQLAKKGAIPLNDLKGGTISLSNIGSIGGTYANPVIVSNELAIVAVGSAKRLPRYDDKSNSFVAKQILPVSWSADHRVVDGATIAQFGNTWKSFIENPALLASVMH